MNGTEGGEKENWKEHGGRTLPTRGRRQQGRSKTAEKRAKWKKKEGVKGRRKYGSTQEIDKKGHKDERTK